MKTLTWNKKRFKLFAMTIDLSQCGIQQRRHIAFGQNSGYSISTAKLDIIFDSFTALPEAK
jgi:hypothetical protein